MEFWPNDGFGFRGGIGGGGRLGLFSPIGELRLFGGLTLVPVSLCTEADCSGDPPGDSGTMSVTFEALLGKGETEEDEDGEAKIGEVGFRTGLFKKAVGDK